MCYIFNLGYCMCTSHTICILVGRLVCIVILLISHVFLEMLKIKYGVNAKIYEDALARAGVVDESYPIQMGNHILFI